MILVGSSEATRRDFVEQRHCGMCHTATCKMGAQGLCIQRHGVRLEGRADLPGLYDERFRARWHLALHFDVSGWTGPQGQRLA